MQHEQPPQTPVEKTSGAVYGSPTHRERTSTGQDRAISYM